MTATAPQVTADNYREIFAEMLGKTADNLREEMRGNQAALMRSIMEGQDPEAARRKNRKYKPGIKAGCYFRALAAARGDRGQAADLAKEWGNEEVSKALGESTLTGGGALVPEDMMEDIIDLLRANVTVRKAGAMTIDLPRGNLTMNRLDVGATASYVGESVNAPKVEQQFGQIRLEAKKLTALTPISNDLLRDASTSADEIVRNDLVQNASRREDLAFLRDDGSLNKPKGLLNWVDPANALSQTGTGTAAEVTSDLGDMQLALEEANIPMTRVAWVFAPRTKKFLMTLRGADDNLLFQPEMITGTLNGFPWFMTTQIPTNLGGGSDESEVYLADFAHIMIGESLESEVAVVDGAAYHDGSAVQSAFSRDETVIRLVSRHDLAPRYSGLEIATLDTVDWGA